MSERDLKCAHCGELLVEISECAQLPSAAKFMAAYAAHQTVCPVLLAEKQQDLRAQYGAGHLLEHACVGQHVHSGLAGAPSDPVSHPSHYTAFPLEVIDVIKRALGPEGFKAYCFGSEIKYRMRAGLKGDDKAAEDIRKAMAYKKFREDAE